MESTKDCERTSLISEESTPNNAKSLRGWLQEISPRVFTLVVIFALPAQLAALGVAVELPLLVETLPEGWALPSYFTLVTQFGNVGPAIFLLLNCLFPNKVKDWAVICVIMLTGGVCSLLMAFFWQETSYVIDGEHSTAFLILLGCMSLTDGTAAVVFWAYMANFKSQYMSALFLGQTFSGVLPAAVGLLQGTAESTCVEVNATISANASDTFPVLEKTSQDPRFSTSVFFVTVFVIYVVSFVAFVIIEFSSVCETEKLTSPENTTTGALADSENGKKKKKRRRRRIHEDDVPMFLATMTPSGFTTECFTGLTETLRESTERDQMEPAGNQNPKAPGIQTLESQTPLGESPDKTESITSCSMVKLFFVCAWLDALSACVIPSLASYGCLPYGHDVYGLTVKLMILAGPIGCAASLFVRNLSVMTICILTIVSTALTTYLVLLAAMSPNPPLYNDTLGDFLVITCHILAIGLMMFVIVSTAVTLQKKGGRKALMLGGSFSQLGSTVGAVGMFLIINVANAFKGVEFQC